MRTNVSEDLKETASRYPDDVALVEPRTGRSVTWAEFDEWADRVAQTLLGRGMVAGQRVALVMANGIDLAVAYYGVLRGGMVAVPINPRSSVRELSRMIGEAAPKIVVADAQSVTQVREAELGNATVVVHRAAPQEGEIRFGELLESASDEQPVSPPDAETLAVIMFTSGATAKPRGVMLSHRALAANVDQLLQVEPPVLGHDSVILGLLPMFHIYGLNAVLGLAVRVGAQVVLLDAFDAELVLHEIREHQVTDVPVAPVMVQRWLEVPKAREALAGVKRIVSGATGLDADIAEQFRTATGHIVEQGYGLTETAPVVSATFVGDRDPETPPTAHSVGQPIPGVEIELRDFLGGPPVPGDMAQIWVRGENLFSGYWPDGSGGPGDDGWWFTDDLGFIDEKGDITLVDRMREKITVSGFGVYPSEIEDIVLEVPGVSQTAVVGVPDAQTGEAVVAFVVPEDESADSAALEAAVLDHTELQLARFKRPTRVLVMAGLPHSPTGKVAKGRLRSLARAETETEAQ